jgi:formyl-CoA transferase
MQSNDETVRCEAAPGSAGAEGRSGALAGIRVLELGTLLAGPFCGQLLADQGADVIKVEPPGQPDPLRAWGPRRHRGHSLVWPIVARNKRCITLDLRQPKGQELLRRLAGLSDILVENFRPGTLEKWGLGPEALMAVNPRLIMVRVSGYGQDGPYAGRAGYASVGEAMAGLRLLIGEPDRVPARTGISLGDTYTATVAALGAMMALQARARTGRGQVVDAAIYESVLGLMEGLIPEWHFEGYARERTGAVLPGAAPSNVYRAADGGLVVVAANQDTVFRRLAEAMGQPDLALDPRFAGHLARGENQGELDALVAAWAGGLETEALLALCEAHGVPAGRLYRAPDLLADAHVRARGAIVWPDHPALGPFPMQAPVPRLSDTPGGVAWTGPEMGAHNEAVYGDLLGLDADTRTALAAARII